MYAVIDADGHYALNLTRVYSAHTFLSDAQQAAQGEGYQIISGADFDVGEVVYGDTIGTVYSRVAK